jgi:hypothetical protein
MLSAQNGWAIAEVEKDLSQHVLFTGDGGETWQDRTPLLALENAPEVGLAVEAYFASSENAWVCYAHAHQPARRYPGGLAHHRRRKELAQQPTAGHERRRRSSRPSDLAFQAASKDGSWSTSAPG